MIVPDQQGRGAAVEKTGWSMPPLLRQREPGAPKGGAGNGSPLPGLVREISQARLGEKPWQTGKIVKTSLIRQDIDTSWFFIAKEGRFVLKEIELIY